MTPDYKQGLLLPKELLDSLTEKENTPQVSLAIFDSTPSYDHPVIFENAASVVQNSGLIFKLLTPPNIYTPNDLLNLPEGWVIDRKVAETSTRLFEGVLEQPNNKKVVLIYESPITSIAWQYFLIDLQVIKEQKARTVLDYLEATLEQLGPHMGKLQTAHSVRVIKSETLLESGTPGHIPTRLIPKFNERISFFNRSLVKASEIFMEKTGKPITYTIS